MVLSAGMKPHHILVIVAHLLMKEWCISNYGVHSPFSNMHDMFLSLIFTLLVLECYVVDRKNVV